MDAVNLKREIIQRGIEKLLDEAKVPQRMHLQVVQALADSMQAHKKTISEHEQRDAQLEQAHQAHQRHIQEWDGVVKHLHSLPHIKGETGMAGRSIKGDKGEDGISPDINDIIKQVSSRIRVPIDGRHGRDGKDADFDEDKVIEKLIKKLQKEKPLDISHIRNASSFMKDGIKYKIEELMRGAGGGSTGTTILPIVTGAVDNSNVTFTFTKTPTMVVVNGANYITGAGVTITGTTAVLDNPVGTGGSIYGIL